MPTQFQANNLDYNDYVGRLAGRPSEKRHARARTIYAPAASAATNRWIKITQVYGWQGLKRVEVASVQAGDIAAIAGIEDIGIGDTDYRSREPARATALADRRTDHRHALLR
jgi:GTP-binding protein